MLRPVLIVSVIVFVFVVCVYTESTDSTTTYSTTTSTTVPPTEEDRLLRKLHDNRVAGNFVIVTVQSSTNLNFTLSWSLGMKKLGFNNFVIVCLDPLLCDSLSNHSSLANNFAAKPSNWTQNDSLTVVAKLFDLSFGLIYSDVSVVWLSQRVVEYLLYTEQYSDFAYMSQMKDGRNMMDLSFFMLKSTALSRDFLGKFIAAAKTDENVHSGLGEQTLWQTDFCTKASFSRLDKLTFTQGYDYFNTTDHAKYGVKPLVVRANAYTTAEQNQESLAKANLWNWQ